MKTEQNSLANPQHPSAVAYGDLLGITVKLQTNKQQPKTYMGKSSSSSSGGIGFAGLLTIVFITLKLIGKIDWSWWWVLSPLWISALLVIGILGVVGIVALIAWLASRK